MAEYADIEPALDFIVHISVPGMPRRLGLTSAPTATIQEVVSAVRKVADIPEYFVLSYDGQRPDTRLTLRGKWRYEPSQELPGADCFTELDLDFESGDEFTVSQRNTENVSKAHDGSALIRADRRRIL